MGHTHTSILIHIVFGTYERHPWLIDDIGKRVHGYIGGAVRGQGATPLRIGGMPDHVHLVVGCRPDMALSTLMREVKSQSSRWIHDEFPALRGFRWQEGYAAFSVSTSQRERVIRYIENQPVHHRRRDFHQELRELLQAHGLELEERSL